MYVRRAGKLVRITKVSIGAVSPSTLKKKREAFERKKKTTAFIRWRRYQYYVKQKSRCALCGRLINGPLVTDHKIPLFRGGTSAYSNLQVTHFSCNQRKSIKILPPVRS